MGNSLRCPSGFNPIGVNGCYVTCPQDKGFVDVQKDGGAPSCAFRDTSGNVDNSTIVIRQQTPFLPPPPQGEETTAPASPALSDIQKDYPDRYVTYTTELERFNQELKVVLEKIGKKRALEAAFQNLQNAENARDTAPEAYLAAKNAYYTLTKGDNWIQDEKKRVEASEVTPVIQRLVDNYTDATLRVQKATRLGELAAAARKSAVGVQDEFAGSIGLLGKQLGAVQNQLNMERKQTEEKTKPLFRLPIVGYILNLLIAVALLFAITMVVRAIRSRQQPPSVFVTPTPTI